MEPSSTIKLECGIVILQQIATSAFLILVDVLMPMMPSDHESGKEVPSLWRGTESNKNRNHYRCLWRNIFLGKDAPQGDESTPIYGVRVPRCDTRDHCPMGREGAQSTDRREGNSPGPSSCGASFLPYFLLAIYNQCIVEPSSTIKLECG